MAERFCCCCCCWTVWRILCVIFLFVALIFKNYTILKSRWSQNVLNVRSMCLHIKRYFYFYFFFFIKFLLHILSLSIFQYFFSLFLSFFDKRIPKNDKNLNRFLAILLWLRNILTLCYTSLIEGFRFSLRVRFFSFSLLFFGEAHQKQEHKRKELTNIMQIFNWKCRIGRWWLHKDVYVRFYSLFLYSSWIWFSLLGFWLTKCLLEKKRRKKKTNRMYWDRIASTFVSLVIFHCPLKCRLPSFVFRLYFIWFTFEKVTHTQTHKHIQAREWTHSVLKRWKRN